MANLGSSTTPIKGEQFELPDGHSFDVDNGDLVWKDSNGSIFARYDEGNSEFVIDSISATSVSADTGAIDTLEAADGVFNDSITGPAGNTTTDLSALASTTYLQETEPSETPSPPPNGTGGVWYPLLIYEGDIEWTTPTRNEATNYGRQVYSEKHGLVYQPLGAYEFGEIYGYNVSDGSQAWYYDIGNNEPKGPVYVKSEDSGASQDIIAVGVSDRGGLLGFNAENGNKLYQESGFTARLGGCYASTQNIIAYGTYDGEIKAFDAVNGSEVWTKGVSGSYTSAPTYIPSEEIVVTHDSGGPILGLNASDGSEKWSYSGREGDSYPIYVPDNETVVLKKSSEGYISLNVSDGGVNWNNSQGPYGSKYSGTYHSPTNQLIVPDDSDLKSLDPSNGSENWRNTSVSIQQYVTDVKGEDFVIAAEDNEGAVAVNVSDGSVKFRTSDSSFGVNVLDIPTEKTACVYKNDGTVKKFEYGKRRGEPRVSDGDEWIVKR